MHFLAVGSSESISGLWRISSHIGSNIRIVALSASLGNAKDLGECRDCVGKTVADLKLLDNTHWKYTFIIITHAPYIKV
jgi:hypothetical protein